MLSTLDAMERKQPNINSELQINLHKLTITTTTARPWGLPGLARSVRAIQGDDDDDDDGDDDDDDECST